MRCENGKDVPSPYVCGRGLSKLFMVLAVVCIIVTSVALFRLWCNVRSNGASVPLDKSGRFIPVGTGRLYGLNEPFVIVTDAATGIEYLMVLHVGAVKLEKVP